MNTKSFEVHFGLDGSANIDNITNVQGEECHVLTKPYEKALGQVVASKEVVNDQVNLNSHVQESQ